MDNIIPKFRRCVIQNFPFIEDDFDALVNYGLMSKIVEYLNKVIDQTNQTTENMEIVTNLVTELKSYVDNYFDNLNVQEEINNKLDDMAEAGTLQEIIATYLGLGTMFTFNTVADMVASEALITGSKCQTLGKNTINDGYGAIYTIGNSGEILLDNGKYATMIGNTQGDNYIEEITITTGRENDCDYTLATIPVNDSDGNIILPSVNEDSTVTPLGYAGKNFTTITANAGLTRQNSSDQWKQGAVISNGVALHGDLCDITAPTYMSYIGFKDDRTVLDFPSNTSTDVMIAQGVKNAYLTFGKIVTNGVVSIDPNVDADQINPMCCVGVKNDGTLGIIASEGRTERNEGMTIAQMAALMLSLGFTNVWRCDGGGSTSLVYKGSKQNRNIDDYATTDRDIHVTLNFKKPTINKQLAAVYSFIGKERQLLNSNIVYDVHERYELKRSFANYFNVTTGYNKMTTADTWTRLHLSDSIAHRRKLGWNLLKDENNRTIGLEFLKTGIYEVVVNAIVQCANTAGDRGLRIDNEGGSGITSHASSASYFAPHAAGDGFEKNLVTSFNVSEGTKIYFSGRGQVNDDFNRLNIVVREIGTADAG